jgi:hypothetical protein
MHAVPRFTTGLLDLTLSGSASRSCFPAVASIKTALTSDQA